MSAITRSVALATALAVSGAGGDAAAQPAPVAGPATTASAAAPAPRAAGRGVVVVALGSGTEGAARSLARDVYGDDVLRPSIDEAAAQVLCGGALPEAASSQSRDLAALRAALDPQPDNPATRRALESLAAELGAAGVVAVFRSADGASRARVVLAGARDGSPVELVARADPATAPSWPGAAAILRALVTPQAAAAASTLPSNPTPATPAGGAPRTGPSAAPRPPAAAAAGASGAPAPARFAEPEAAAESREFWERPWFWVALGAFAAAGVTALVVTTTAGADEPSDSVRFRATIPEAQLTF